MSGAAPENLLKLLKFLVAEVQIPNEEQQWWLRTEVVHRFAALITGDPRAALGALACERAGCVT